MKLCNMQVKKWQNGELFFFKSESYKNDFKTFFTCSLTLFL